MGRRSDHSREEIRRMCLASATQRIRDSGLGNLSIRKLAGDIGYTPGTLYQVFKNLDDLILAVNQQTLGELEQHLSNALCNATPGIEQLLALAEEYIHFAHREPQLWLALFEHRVASETTRPPSLQQQIDALFALADQALQHYPDIPASHRELATHTLWSGIHGICVLSLNGKLSAPTPEQLAHDLITRYTQSLLQPNRCPP